METKLSAAGDEKTSISYPVGPDAKLILRRHLTPAQERRLEHITALLTDILEDDD